MSATIKYTDMGLPEEDALWKYTALTDPLLTSELRRLAFATTHGDTHCVSFQPCPNPDITNQDRYVIQDWPLSDGLWSFRAVFDGHIGHATVDYATESLPPLIQREIACNSSRAPEHISQILADSIVAFDDSIAQDLLNVLPDQHVIEHMSDAQLQELINDLRKSEESMTIIQRCIHGSTALVALIDPPRKNLWVASLGDCQAVLGQKDATGRWHTSVLSGFHNGRDKDEVEHIRHTHPNESACVHNHRVLGAISLTRALGDHAFKLPPTYTERLFPRIKSGFHFGNTSMRDFFSRNLTPPYLSNQPEVRHVKLSGRLQNEKTQLILFSDGLIDCYFDEAQHIASTRLPEILFKAIDNRDASTAAYNNLALAILRHALGGEDTEKVSRNITVEMCFKWMDDTTVLVQRI